MKYEGKYFATKFEPDKWVILVQSTKIGTHENKAIHSTLFIKYRTKDTLSSYGHRVKARINLSAYYERIPD